jgi:peptidoglycan/xylan/chitin deacetylase (PgdA/CDA1 family)
MRGWLDPLRMALDAANEPVTFFFRDDDAGWADDRLLELLHVFARYGVPVDLAVIPQALDQLLARRLLACAEAHPGAIGLHQHGFAHRNHEPVGRKQEFGPSRSREQQRSDIAEGRRRLHQLLGPFAQPIFTPPWNRCTAVTISCVAELGFRALSRDARAEPPVEVDLFELPVRVDWFAKRKGAPLGRDEVGELLARSVASDAAVGVMLHHVVMGAGERRRLNELLALVATHPRVRCRSMLELTQSALGASPAS